MFRIQKKSDLGTMKLAWLDTRYHFSFYKYYNPDRMGVGNLKVINDDIVAPHSGFDMHPHRDMEIITYVRSGALAHRDNLGNSGKTSAGNVQVMSAGKGIIHAEHNEENEPCVLYQIWIEPNERRVQPRWDTKEFPHDPVTDKLNLLVSGRDADKDSGALFIHQDAAIYGGVLPKGAKLTHHMQSNNGYVLVARGKVDINGHTFEAADGTEVLDESTLKFIATDEAEVLVVEV